MVFRRASNPTPLTVGAKGLFQGRQAMVTGWAALRSSGGYRWDEYQVVFADRSTLLLVYERGLWKRFDRFDPQPPVTWETADGASAGRMVPVGDRLYRVTYVSASRVLAVEGDMPAGYSEGQEDDYFNAESNDEMVVVTWVDARLECYRGRVLPHGAVEAAFNLPLPSLLSAIRQRLTGLVFNPNSVAAAVTCAIGCLVLASFIHDLAANRSPTADPPPPLPLPPPELAVERSGRLAGQSYRITGHRVVRVDDPAGEFSRHEYDLTDEQGLPAVLIEGLDRDPRQWVLFRPAAASVAPYLAATFTPRSHLLLDGNYAIVRRLFRCENLAIAGPAAAHERLHEVRYAFEAETRTGPALARWTATDIEFLAGRGVPEAEVTAAFGPLRSR